MSFNSRKAVEAILLIADLLPALTRHTLAKVFYFADKSHLEQYGRLICGDRYIAMKNGPVPSGIYDIVKSPERLARDALRPNPSKEVFALRKPNLEALSDSEIECITESVKTYGRRSFEELTRLSHDSAWRSADANDEIDLESIALTVEDSDALISYLRDPHPEPEEQEWPQRAVA